MVINTKKRQKMDGQSLQVYTSILTCNMNVDYAKTDIGEYDVTKNTFTCIY